MKNRIPKYYFHRIFFLSIIISFLLLFPILIVSVIHYLPNKFEKLYADKTSQNLNSVLVQKISQSKSSHADSLLFLLKKTKSKEISDFLKTHKEILDSVFDKDTLAVIMTKIDSLENVYKTNIDNEGIEFSFSKKVDSDDKSEEYSKMLTLLWIILFIFLLYLAAYTFNFSFKRYFKNLRKRRTSSEKQTNFVRRHISKTPLILSTTYILPAIVLNIYFYITSEISISAENPIKFVFLISMITLILVGLFIYTWQRHRINLYYLEYIFTKEELRQTIISFRASKIKYRMVTSNIITTILPLIIVGIYISLSFETVSYDNLDYKEKSILLGKYTKFINPVNIEKKKEFINQLIENFSDENNNLVYVNIIDRLLMIIGIISSITVVIFYIFLLVKWNTQDIVKPVKDLLASIKEVSKDASNEHFTIVRNNDEIGELTAEFNKMSSSLKNYIKNISKLKDTYYRFVPKQFLDFLNKDNLTLINPGDCVEEELTIMFADIRNYTTISETLGPKGNFKLINTFLSELEPVIQEEQGFVDKYSGDSIMAIFPKNPEFALRSAEKMFRKIAKLNNDLKDTLSSELEIGIGVNTGKVMLGIIGSKERINATVLSDNVNIAYRLESLTRKYSTNLIIGENAYKNLPKTSDFKIRELDDVKVKGKQQAIKIYEVLDVLTKDHRDMIIDLLDDFKEGRKLFSQKRFVEAEKIFSRLSLEYADYPSKVFLERCQKLKNSDSETFDGVTTFIDK